MVVLKYKLPVLKYKLPVLKYKLLVLKYKLPVERCRYRRKAEISHFTSSNLNHSSFSSSLLDVIYHSIDQGDNEMVICREGMRNKTYVVDADANTNLRRPGQLTFYRVIHVHN